MRRKILSQPSSISPLPSSLSLYPLELCFIVRGAGKIIPLTKHGCQAEINSVAQQSVSWVSKKRERVQEKEKSSTAEGHRVTSSGLEANRPIFVHVCLHPLSISLFPPLLPCLEQFEHKSSTAESISLDRDRIKRGMYFGKIIIAHVMLVPSLWLTVTFESVYIGWKLPTAEWKTVWQRDRQTQ